jgi:lysozyme family protein
MSFEKAFAHTLRWEGGYANIAEDRGGETYMGIARNIHPFWPGWQIIDNYKANVGPIAWNQKIDNPNLEYQVYQFYKTNKWDKHRLGMIYSSDVAAKVFDMIVNHGQGSRLVQQAVNAVAGKEKLKEDNFVGPKTVAAINSLSPSRLLDKLLEIRREYYHKIVERDPSQQRFIKGWLRRLESFQDAMDKKKA